MMERNCTKHIAIDRPDRTAYILINVGLGRIIKERKRIDEEGKISYECLTSTGVIRILDATKKITITCYVASVDKVCAMYEGNTPSWVLAKARKNKHHAEMQNKVRYKDV